MGMTDRHERVKDCATCSGSGQYPAAVEPLPCLACGGTRDICFEAMLRIQGERDEALKELKQVKEAAHNLDLLYRRSKVDLRELPEQISDGILRMRKILGIEYSPLRISDCSDSEDQSDVD